jgi:hypothetical protein
MNLALGVLVIFIIAIPGIVFRLTYLSSPYSKRTISTTAIDEIFNSLIPAFIFHGIFILILDAAGKQVDFQFIYNLLIGNNTAKNIDALNGYLAGFMTYMLINTAVNFACAWLLRQGALKYKWYQKLPILSIYNKWYHVLKPESNENGKISVWLDVLVETKTGDLLYRGFLTDFWLDKDGGIRELHFENVRRRVFTNDPVREVSSGDPGNESEEIAPTEEQLREVDQRYYYIPGERFIIKYEDVRNMNITYYEELLTAD